MDLESQKYKRVYLIVDSLTDTEICYTKSIIKYLNFYILLETVEKSNKRDVNFKLCKSSIEDNVVENKIDISIYSNIDRKYKERQMLIDSLLKSTLYLDNSSVKHTK